MRSLFALVLACVACVGVVQGCPDCSAKELNTAELVFSLSTPNGSLLAFEPLLTLYGKPAAFGPCPAQSSLLAKPTTIFLSPNSADLNYCNVSSSLADNATTIITTTTATTGGASGDDTAPLQVPSGAAVLVNRGACPFWQKVETVQKLGGSMVIVMLQDDEPLVAGCNPNDSDPGACFPSIPVVVISKTSAAQVRLLIGSQQQQQQPLAVSYYWRNAAWFDPSTVVIFLLALFTAFTAAWWSASAERESLVDPTATIVRHQNEEETPMQHITLVHIIVFLVCGSGVLLLLFFLMDYLLTVIVVMFCIGSTNALVFVASPFLARFFPRLRQTKSIRCWGTVSYSSLVALPFAAAIAIFWFFNRSAWVIQDLLSVCICIVFLSTIRIPNLKIAALLLGLALIYDVFWVYISPLIFHGQSVMVAVATGEGQQTEADNADTEVCARSYGSNSPVLPMLLIVPRILSWAPGANLLGLGDIVLPSLLTSYALRFDYWKINNSRTTMNRSTRWFGLDALTHLFYFRVAAIGYIVGLFMADVAVFIIGAQPALLYLSPSTVLPLAFCAWRKGELRIFWNGPEQPKEVATLPLEPLPIDLESGELELQHKEGKEGGVGGGGCGDTKSVGDDDGDDETRQTSGFKADTAPLLVSRN